MRKLLLFLIVFMFGLFLFSKPATAQSCVCDVNSTRATYIKTSCGAGYVSRCTGDPWKGTLGCECISEDSGVNCVKSGKPETNQTCCAGYTLNNVGVCVSVSTSNNVSCDNGTGIKTAIGCVHVLDTSESFLTDVLKWATGIGGGIAFLLILYAGFMIMTASGNPERLKAGQELLTSALSGLILLVLSIFILKFIGIDILGLDKFGFGK